MNWMKKWIAAAMAVLMVGSLAACHTGQDTNWIAQMGEETIPAGIYLGLMFDQYYTQTNKLVEDGAEMPKKPLDADLGGKKVSDVIVEETRKSLGNFLAIEAKFKEMGLSFTPEEDASFEQELAGYWEFLKDTYLANGISKESYALMTRNSFKKEAIFNAIYGEGGTEAIPETELQEKFTKDYAKVLVIPLALSASEDPTEKADADKKARDAIAKFKQMAESGTDMEDVVFEARKETASDPESLTKPEKGTSYTFVSRDNSIYADEVTQTIFDAEIGKVFTAETEQNVYLFMRYEINENPEDYKSYTVSMMGELKNEEFETRLVEWATQLQEITVNEAAVKRYTPNKLKMLL